MTDTTETDPRPAWFVDGVAAPFEAGNASVFILHGDANCLVRDPDDADAYVPMRKFFEKIFDQRELVIFYDVADGAWFLSEEMEQKFRKVAGLGTPKADGADAVAAAKASLAAKRELPIAPEACLPLIQKALRYMEGVAVIITSAHTVAPAGGAGLAMPLNDRANIQRLRKWGQSTQIRKNGNIVLLLTDQAAKISQELRTAESEIPTVFIPKPTKAERRAFIAAQEAETDGKGRGKGKTKAKDKKLETDALAHATQGMSLRQIDELFKEAKPSGKPPGLAYVKKKKREMLNAEYGDIMEIVEPKRGLEDIGGHEHIKDFFRGVLEAIRKGEYRLVPMGATLMGPPGTGKTALVEALAKEADFNFVKIKNIRSMWVGESEARMEKLIYGLRSLAPVVVMNDEADLAESGRDSYKGDSGVSERIMKMWMEFLSDPAIRGQIIVLNCTNRPDRIDPAIKRDGRSDVRILMPMPSAEERQAIFAVMFRRHELPSDIKDFAPFAALTKGLSGANIEKVTLDAFRFASGRGRKKIDAEALREAIEDFIPSASTAEIDAMTMAGLIETSARSLLPRHLPEIIGEIRTRNLLANIDELMAQLRERNILPPETLSPAAVETSAN